MSPGLEGHEDAHGDFLLQALYVQQRSPRDWLTSCSARIMQVRITLTDAVLPKLGKMALDNWNVFILDDRILFLFKRVLKLSAFAYAGFGDLVNSRATDSAILALTIMMTGHVLLVHDPIAVIIKAIVRHDQVISNPQFQANSIHPRKHNEQPKNHSTCLAHGNHIVKCILLYPDPQTYRPRHNENP